MLQNIFKDTIASGLKRRAIATCSKWARTYRVMGAPYAGLWTPDPAPWTLAMHDSEASMNIGQKSAQMGYTETVLNITLFKMDMESLDCLYVLPSRTPDASEFSAARFDPAIELSPHLKNLFSSVKNVGHKRAGPVNLYIRGSKVKLKSLPVAFIVFDELDEMKQKNIPDAEERVSGHTNTQIWKISTPTLPNLGINILFEESTQEHYIFKCPHCARHIELMWPDSIQIIGESHIDPRIKESYLICTKCKSKLDHDDKINFLKNGTWESFGDPKIDTRGFYINQLYSIPRPPWEIVEVYFQSLIDKPSEQRFFNSKLGLPHIVEGAQVKLRELNEAKCNRRKADPIPNNKIITMGVDQGRWLYHEICAWSFPKLGNDLNMIAECEVLTEGKVVDFNELDDLMQQYQILKVVIDAQPDRRKAYEFACKYWGHVHLCFYARGQQVKTITIDPNEDQHKITVDRTSWLDVALNRFHTNRIKIPQDVSAEYIEHLQNLIKHYSEDTSGNPIGIYKNIGPDHLAHARCYAEIALPLAASLQTNQNVRIYL